MTLRQACEALKNKSVVVNTTANKELSGTLRDIGDDYIDVHWATGKSTIIPLGSVVSVKEQ